MSPHLRPPPLRLAMPVSPLSPGDGFAALLPSPSCLRDGVLGSAGDAVQPGLLPADEKPQRSILSGSELTGRPGRCGEGPRPPGRLPRVLARTGLRARLFGAGA